MTGGDRLRDMIACKSEYQSKLIYTIGLYCDKYIRKIWKRLEDEYKTHNNPRIVRKYLSVLRDIPDWSYERIYKEYKKFSKWCYKKAGTSEEKLQRLFDQHINYCIQIMTRGYAQEHVDKVMSRMRIPKLKDLFYKSLKRIARAYYETTGTTEQFDIIDKRHIEHLVDTLLHTFVPVESVIALIERGELREDSDYYYDFDSPKSPNRTSTSRNSKRRVSVTGSDKEYRTSEHGSEINRGGLRYVPSDDIYNEYFLSDQEIEPEGSSTSNVGDVDEKLINIPRLKGGANPQPPNNYYN